MGKVKFLSGFILGAMFFVACSTADIKFPYEFWHASPIQVWQQSEGQLIGAKGKRKPLTDCYPRKNKEGKLEQQCVVVFYHELNKFVADYKKKSQDLIDCQRGR